MKRKGMKQEAAAEGAEADAMGASAEEAAAPEDLTPAVAEGAEWDGPTRAGGDDEIADLAAQSIAQGEGQGDGTESPAEIDAAAETPGDAEAIEPEPVVESGRLESILESLLYAADRALTVNDLKKLVNERDGKKLTAALELLRERHAATGIQLASLAGGWQFRTHPDNGPWVAKLIAGRPQRLSRAMLEALAIVAYRQPITRPEIDEIRGVDCGPVLKTLLDRNFVRILGKKEDVGRPMLYGTTPEFLRIFSLKDLSELPTLREFHELSEQHMAAVDAQAPLAEGAAPAQMPMGDTTPARSPFAPTPMDLTPVDQEEEDELLGALDEATTAATRATAPPSAPAPSAETMAADAPAGEASHAGEAREASHDTSEA